MTKNSIEKATEIAVSSGQATLLMAVKTNTHDVMAAQIKVVSGHALNQFIIKAQVSPDSPVQTIYSTSGVFNAPEGRLLTSSGDLTTLAVDAVGSFDLNVSGYYSVELYASSSNVAGSVVSVFAGLR